MNLSFRVLIPFCARFVYISLSLIPSVRSLRRSSLWRRIKTGFTSKCLKTTLFICNQIAQRVAMKSFVLADFTPSSFQSNFRKFLIHSPIGVEGVEQTLMPKEEQAQTRVDMSQSRKRWLSFSICILHRWQVSWTGMLHVNKLQLVGRALLSSLQVKNFHLGLISEAQSLCQNCLVLWDVSNLPCWAR